MTVRVKVFLKASSAKRDASDEGEGDNNIILFKPRQRKLMPVGSTFLVAPNSSSPAKVLYKYCHDETRIKYCNS
jgi:hypothetical protein